MNNTFYFLRHAETKVDKDTPISKWELSVKGKEQARKLANANIFSDVDLIFSSSENKAYQTALPVAQRFGKEIVKLKDIVELDRDGGIFMSPDEYEMTIKRCLENPDKSLNNWETASHALERFSKKISELENKHENKKILIVSHGFTINMYFAILLGSSDKTYERLKSNDFADWGIIKNKKVVKDIVK